MSLLKLGIPKGSLQNATIALFKRSGWNINVNGRSYFPEIDDSNIECAICRAQEMSRYVEDGTMDAGLTGKDWIAENESDIKVVADLIYSKVSSRPARWVVAVPYDSKVEKIEDWPARKLPRNWWDIPNAISRKMGLPLMLNSPGAPPKPRWFPVWPMPSSR